MATHPIMIVVGLIVGCNFPFTWGDESEQRQPSSFLPRFASGVIFGVSPEIWGMLSLLMMAGPTILDNNKKYHDQMILMTC